ncbi:MAG: RNA polymerase sigma factor [Myxococcota bacterium]
MAVARQSPGSGASSDDQLIERILAGDEGAFSDLYDRYFTRVYRFVQRRLDNRADVEDTVQEVFIAVFSSLESFRGEAPFGAWVLGISRRTIAARFKRKRHTMVPLEGYHEDPRTIDVTMPMIRREPTPLEVFECEERVEQLEQVASEKLTPEQRRLFELHHLSHRPIQEIAEALQKSEDAVKSNLYRARKLLLAR